MTDSEQVVVAQIGDKIITVDEFRYNYEFGFPHLKKGPDGKRSFLEYMIKEEILAHEGYRLGLDKSERIKKLEKELLDELLVEELFIKEVHDKIKITPDEINDAITKSKVKWKLRYWVEPNLEYANSVCRAMQEQGYSAVVDKILRSNPEVKMKPEDFETDYLTWLDVTPELLEAIKNIPIGEISDPIEINGAYYIFQIVDIRREPLTEYEIQTNAGRYKKILFYRKVKEEALRFVSDFMTPKNVVTKGDAFRKLSAALYAWEKKNEKSKNDFNEMLKSVDDIYSAIFKLKQDLNQTLVTFENGQWTISDFLSRFDVKSARLNAKDEQELRTALNQQIALKVRNHFFTLEAIDRKLHLAPSVQNQLQIWRDKWVYEKVRDRYTINLRINEDQARKYFLEFKDRYKIRWDDEPTFNEFESQSKRDAYIKKAKLILEQKIDSLIAVYPVVINQAVLDTITVIDFKKSKWASLQVYKMSSNRLARPIVDPAWGF